MKIKANAKINLALDVIGKRDDGYHSVSMLMQEVTLCDNIEIIPNDSAIVDMKLINSNLPCDDKNIAIRAAKLFFKNAGINGGCTIILEKNIPVCAGLGGGSSDAAAVLKALNELYGFPLSKDKLLSLALSLGADVPFFIIGAAARAEGIGEVLTPVSSKLGGWVCIIKPDIDISTPLAYKAIDSLTYPHPDIDKVIDAAIEGNREEFINNAANVFEYVCCPIHPEIDCLKKHLIENGAFFAMMSGSGPSVFGLFENKADAERAFNSYKGSFQGGGVCSLVE